MRTFVSLVYLLAGITITYAHPGEHHPILSRTEQTELESVIKRRHTLASKCSDATRQYSNRRKSKRGLTRRESKRQLTSGFSTATLSASEPTISQIQNFTCVTAPEVTEGPYYINNELIRQDLREDQPGITLELDIGVLDTVSCEPLSGVFVELWSCNATGFYSGYSSAIAASPGGGTSPGPSEAPSGSIAIPSSPPSSASAIPSGGPSGGLGGGSTALTDNSTFLRGGYPTNAYGIVGLTTIYPGFYEGRTVHIHVMVHHNWSANDNGTIISHSGTVQHTGQFFFDDAWNEKVLNTTVYLADTNVRTYNSEDSIFFQEAGGGNTAYVEVEMVGDTIEEGLIGYITMGVNTSEVINIDNTNYYNSSAAITEATEEL